MYLSTARISLKSYIDTTITELLKRKNTPYQTDRGSQTKNTRKKEIPNAQPLTKQL
jgi:hypothetical protein